MKDEIQLVMVRTGADVVTEAGIRHGEDKDGKLVLHSGYQDWTIFHYKAYYPTSLDTWRFSAMFPDGRNKKMFDRRGSRHGADIGAWEKRWNALKVWCPG